MQWMVPRSRLGAEQILVLDACMRPASGPQWIQGFAGSGKTVLLVHAMHQVRVTQPTASMCFVTFTHALKDLIRTGFSDQLRDVPVMTHPQFKRAARRYDYVFVDEIQDLSPDIIELLRQNAGQIIVAGDTDQSIYDQGSGAEDILRILSPQRHHLQVLYRLTQRLRELACAILPGSSIEAARNSRMESVQIVLGKAEDEETEFRWVWTQASARASIGSPTLVLLPGHREIYRLVESICRSEGKPIVPKPHYENKKLNYEETNRALAKSEIPLQYLGNDFGSLAESDSRPLTYIMTYHSAKGLDFEFVFIPRLNSDMKIWKDNPDRERRLFFVGITRSRKDLYLTYSTKHPHPFVELIPANLLTRIDCKIEHADEETDDFFF